MKNEFQPASPAGGQPAFPLWPILLATGIFYLTFVCRIIMGPLLPVVQKEMGWGHGDAGSIFVYVASGYSIGLLIAAYAFARLNCRVLITTAGIMAGVSMLALSQFASPAVMRLSLVVCGVSAGLYMPCGIAFLTDVAAREHWGKAMAVHELGPNLGYVTAPILTEILIRFLPWRGVLAAVAVCSICMGLVFFVYVGGRGSQKGTPPNLAFMRSLFKNPSFWTMVALFTLSVGGSIGVYSLMPLFLVSEAGFERGLANTVISLSRVCSLGALVTAGMIVDRFGPRKAIVFFLAATGLFTLLVGFWQNSTATIILVFFQAAASASLFPVAFTTLSQLFPAPLRGAAVSLVFFVCYPFAAGAIPSAVGHWADAFSFSSGFGFLGLFFLVLLPLFLRRGDHFENSK